MSESVAFSVGTANMVGVILSNMTFGFHLALLVQVNRIYHSRIRSLSDCRLTTRDWRLLAYVYVLFLLATTGLCLQTWVNHDAFVVHSSYYPGGSLGYLAQQTQHPVHTAMITIYIALNWIADGMVLYRMYVLFMYSRYVMAACIITMLTLIGVGSAFIRTVQVSGLNLWTNYRIAPCVAYLALSFFINFVLTFVIVARLLWIRRQMCRSIGSRHTRIYISIAAMLVESAALYTIVTLVSIVACATRNPIENALLPMLGQLQAIPPLLIIVRVMEGRGVTAETSSNMEFHHTTRLAPLEVSERHVEFKTSSNPFMSSTTSPGAVSNPSLIDATDAWTPRSEPPPRRSGLHLMIETQRNPDNLFDDEWGLNSKTAVDSDDDEPRRTFEVPVSLPTLLPTAITPKCTTCPSSTVPWKS
ncbi:hypothetical protein BC628DRAFT_193981 [Trametes gibbosa]|nr:hypothetical protein BC628DRAFT_193981 [Trametes gibbosa]